MAVGISPAVIVGGHFPMSPPRFKKNKDMGEGVGGGNKPRAASGVATNAGSRIYRPGFEF